MLAAERYSHSIVILQEKITDISTQAHIQTRCLAQDLAHLHRLATRSIILGQQQVRQKHLIARSTLGIMRPLPRRPIRHVQLILSRRMAQSIVCLLAKRFRQPLGLPAFFALEVLGLFAVLEPRLKIKIAQLQCRSNYLGITLQPLNTHIYRQRKKPRLVRIINRSFA